MASYAIAHLRNVTLGDDIVAYLQAIDATLAPFGGEFLVHGNAAMSVKEGALDGDLIVIAFPDRKAADGWYESSAYQAILPLRTDNSEGLAVIVDGVEPGHRATDILG